jgi:hypothetical protein
VFSVTEVFRDTEGQVLDLAGNGSVEEVRTDSQLALKDCSAEWWAKTLGLEHHEKYANELRGTRWHRSYVHIHRVIFWNLSSHPFSGKHHIKRTKPGSKGQGRMFFLTCGSWTYKLNVYRNTYMITHTHIVREIEQSYIGDSV